MRDGFSRNIKHFDTFIGLSLRHTYSDDLHTHKVCSAQSFHDFRFRFVSIGRLSLILIDAEEANEMELR
jgi:hypothetical protein